MEEVSSGNYESNQQLLNADVALLHASWRSEAQSPEILPFRARLVRDVAALLREQQVGTVRFVTIDVYSLSLI
jgi:hypothetical protein